MTRRRFLKGLAVDAGAGGGLALGGYDERFRQIGKRFPGIDLAILENGQYNVRWLRVHTNVHNGGKL